MLKRQSDLFGQTLRQPPAELESPGAVWLARAAYWREGAWLPLGSWLLERLTNRLRAALEARGGLPLLQAEAAALAESEIRSWRQLPRWLWQPVVQRGRARPAAGALGAGRSPALRVDGLLPTAQDDLTGLLADWAAALPLDALDLLEAETLTGRGGLFPHPLGTETVLTCPDCGYAAHRAAARRGKPRPAEEAPRPLETVSTPGCHTIADLCAFLDIPPARTAKAVFLTMRRDGQEQVVFAVVRGDMALNEARLAHLLGAESLRPATEAEIRALGAEPGYASPVGLEGALVVVDDLIPHAPNLTAGGNAPDVHLRNVNYGRDFRAELVADLALAEAGDPCPRCGAPLAAQTGFWLWQLDAPRALETRYSDAEGRPQPVHHAALQMDLGRLAGALAERFHDADGLRWPLGLAPFDVHLVWLPGRKLDTRTPAESLAEALSAAGWRVLLDDRQERPGVKFKDADLLGLPWRVTVGERALAQGQVEIKRRSDGERWSVPLEEAVRWLEEAARA